MLQVALFPNCMARAKTRWPLGADNTPAFPAAGHRSLARHSRCTQQSVPTRTQISAISNQIFWQRVARGSVVLLCCLHITKERKKNYTAARHSLPTRPHLHVHTVRTTLVQVSQTSNSGSKSREVRCIHWHQTKNRHDKTVGQHIVSCNDATLPACSPSTLASSSGQCARVSSLMAFHSR